jgi:hypothetical protein
MIATATLLLSQKDYDLYDIVALAEVLGTPRSIDGTGWFFDHQVCDEPVSFDEDEEAIAMKHWIQQVRDVEALLGQEFADFVACKADIECALEEWEADERRAYQRDMHRGRVLR